MLGKISGALYESIFVVEMSSIGAEILCLIVPEKECFAVRDLFGMSDVLPLPPLDLLVVKALERDIFAKYGKSYLMFWIRWIKKLSSPSTNGMVGR